MPWRKGGFDHVEEASLRGLTSRDLTFDTKTPRFVDKTIYPPLPPALSARQRSLVYYLARILSLRNY